MVSEAYRGGHDKACMEVSKTLASIKGVEDSIRKIVDDDYTGLLKSSSFVDMRSQHLKNINTLKELCTQQSKVMEESAAAGMDAINKEHSPTIGDSAWRAYHRTRASLGTCAHTRSYS